MKLRTGLRTALDAIDGPAAVITDRLDVVATNPLGRALLAPVLDAERANLARFLFLDESASKVLYPEWDRIADEHIHRLRVAAQRDPHDRDLHRLIGELSTGSGAFRTRWSAKRVRDCHSPRLLIDHPTVGELELFREDLTPRADPLLTLRVYTAEADSASAERLRILASWTQEPVVMMNTASDGAYKNRSTP